MSLRERAAEVMRWKLLAEAVAEEYHRLRGEALEALEAEGVLKVGVEVGGNNLGDVSVIPGKARPAVTGHTALFKWVEAHRPDELDQVIRPSFVNALKNICEEEGVAIDRETGEVIPGIEMMPGEATLRITPTRDAKAAALEQVRRLVAGDLPVIGPA